MARTMRYHQCFATMFRFSLPCALILLTPACRKETPKPEPAVETPKQTEPPVPKEIPTQIEIPVPIDDPNRWLFVEKVADGAMGGWATGSFDEERNKLSITTSDVAEFALDTSLIKINWKKLVVLSIDCKNSELRKRNFDILHLRRSAHGEWAVRKP